MKDGLYLHGKQGEATVTMTQHRQGYGASMDDGLGRWVAFCLRTSTKLCRRRTHAFSFPCYCFTTLPDRPQLIAAGNLRPGAHFPAAKTAEARAGIRQCTWCSTRTRYRMHWYNVLSTRTFWYPRRSKWQRPTPHGPVCCTL